MSEQLEPVDEVLSRDEIRARLIGSTPAAQSEIVTIFKTRLEVKTPPLEEILSKGADAELDTVASSVQMIIDYCYVPGTDEKVFEDTDAPFIRRWPFTADLMEFQRVISRLTGIDIEGAMEDLQSDPLAEQS